VVSFRVNVNWEIWPEKINAKERIDDGRGMCRGEILQCTAGLFTNTI